MELQPKDIANDDCSVGASQLKCEERVQEYWNVYRILVPLDMLASIFGSKGEYMGPLSRATRCQIRVVRAPPGTHETVVTISAKEERDALISPAMDGLLRIQRKCVPLIAKNVTARLLVDDQGGVSPMLREHSILNLFRFRDAHGFTIRVFRTAAPTTVFGLPGDAVFEIHGSPPSVRMVLALIANHLRQFPFDHDISHAYEIQMRTLSIERTADKALQKSWNPLLSPTIFPFMNLRPQFAPSSSDNVSMGHLSSTPQPRSFVTNMQRSQDQRSDNAPLMKSWGPRGITSSQGDSSGFGANPYHFESQNVDYYQDPIMPPVTQQPHHPSASSHNVSPGDLLIAQQGQSLVTDMQTLRGGRSENVALQNFLAPPGIASSHGDRSGFGANPYHFESQNVDYYQDPIVPPVIQQPHHLSSSSHRVSLGDFLIAQQGQSLVTDMQTLRDPRSENVPLQKSLGPPGTASSHDDRSGFGANPYHFESQNVDYYQDPIMPPVIQQPQHLPSSSHHVSLDDLLNAQQGQSLVTDVTKAVQGPLSYEDALMGLRRIALADVKIEKSEAVPGDIVKISGSDSPVEEAPRLTQNIYDQSRGPNPTERLV